MENKKHLEDLSAIKEMMEKSSRFISLSGLSGVFAGLSALVGGVIMYWYYDFKWYPYYEDIYDASGNLIVEHLIVLSTTAFLVLLSAICFGIFFTVRKSKKQGIPIWGKTSKLLLINLSIPLIAGGIFCLILIYHRLGYLVAPCTLIFYGLALLNGSKFTFDEIRYLGISEIILGLIGCIFIGYALPLWVVGFGLLHIIYGLVMYRKYEK